MSSNWRLTKKEIALIAYALKQLDEKQLPENVYEIENISETDFSSLTNRFHSAANHFASSVKE